MRLRQILCLGAMLVSFTTSLSAQDTVTVYAPTSIRNALNDVSRRYEKTHGTKITLSYATTAALMKQIENGAQADIFISADTVWMDYATEHKFVKSETRRNLVANRLVLIAPQRSSAHIKIEKGFALAKLLGNDRLAIGDPASVSAGKYARAALGNLGVWKEVESKIVTVDTMPAAFALLACGEAALAITYRADAVNNKDVRIVGEFPDYAHPPIVYPVALLTTARGTAPSAFLAYLYSPPARAIFDKYGLNRSS